MGYIIVDKGRDSERSEMRDNMRDNMRQRGGGVMVRNTGNYRDGYRDGYEDGMRDARQGEFIMQHRNDDGQFM